MISVFGLFGPSTPPNWQRVSFDSRNVVSLRTLDGDSPFTTVSPSLVNGDAWVQDNAVTPGSYATTTSSDGTFSYDAASDASRQYCANALYDYNLRDWYPTDDAGDYFLIAVNDSAPAPTSPPSYFIDTRYDVALDTGTISLADLTTDIDGDTFTFALQSGSLPTNWSLSSNGDLDAPQSVLGSYTFTIRVTDNFGAYTDVSNNILIGTAAPQMIGELLSVGQAAFTAAGATVTSTEVTSPATANTILGQEFGDGTDIDSGAIIVSGDAVTLFYSSGSTGTTLGATDVDMVIYEISPTGKTEWKDYLSVKVVVPTTTSTFNAAGAYRAIELTDVTGLTAWVDYIPVVRVVDGDAGRWRFDNNGFMPIILV